MVALVDMEAAKLHLRMDGDSADEIISIKIDHASAIVLDYLKLDEAPDPVPQHVEAATLLVLEALFDGGEPLSDTVTSLLHRSRDPALA